MGKRTVAVSLGLTYCVVVLVINTAVDAAYVVLNPKLRVA